MVSQIEEVALGTLSLDPRNPRLGRRLAEDDISQPAILALMRAFSLEELGTSFVESGFWYQEALLCVEENVDGAPSLVVVEGNRRLAALTLLKRSVEGNPPSPAWAKIVDGWAIPQGFFDTIPILRMPNRQSVDIYLGFRHVTGIKQWDPAEKAEYIAYLIDQRDFSYDEVMRKIGSKTEAVRRNYIAYRVYRQAGQTENVDETKIIEKFSVLFLALRSAGVQNFLGVDIAADPVAATTPVPDSHITNLRDFVRWLFGQEDVEPLVKDSRQIDKFARILESGEAVAYLRSASRPTIEHAYVISGGEAAEILSLLSASAFNVEQALATLHLYEGDDDIAKVVMRLVKAARQIEKLFPVDQD
jgi:hypothetical protein